MRMSACARHVCLLTLLAAPAAAQSTTEDGIRAVVRGDYQAAARILRPPAEDVERPDPVAQFFLGIVYRAGQGVQYDEGRACGLFLRSAARQHPFAEQAAAIAEDMRKQLGAGASLLCIANESWQGGPPQSFLLGPDHRIVFTDTSITVTNGDQEQRGSILIPREAVALPIQYTPLTVSKPLATRRHFFQWFQWTADRAINPSSWTLGWTLIEVVGDHWIAFTGERHLASVNGSAPPESLDVTRLVRLRVNANGEAEFEILGGASPRTEVIPPQVSR